MKKFHLKNLLYGIVILIGSSAFAQNENDIWCFGNHAGVDFTSGSPVAFGGAQTAGAGLEGCSSIADATGTLLFYTDGISVWNKNHVLMPNGSGLLGHISTSEGALIVPKPGSTNLYYVFSLDQYNGLNGLHYSEVDMNAAGGLGDVVQLNTPLNSGVIYSEKMIAIHHSNGTDIWLIVHSSYTNEFHSYLVSSSGVSSIPVVSTVGNVFGGDDAVGTMRCSLDGTRIAAAYWGALSGFELFDFDKSTGILSNPVYLTDPAYHYAYSVCFSPDGHYLYGGCFNTLMIYQFDLSQAIPPGVLIQNTNNEVGDMQLGPDSIIYVSLYGQLNLAAFLSPDSAGAASNFTTNAVSLIGAACEIGLPNYIYPILNAPPTALFNAPNHICPGTCTDFSNLSVNATSYVWLFPGANPSVSTDVNPASICYSTPGSYSVTLIATNQNGTDTLTLPNFITVFPQPPPQGIIQNGDTLFATQGATSYQWYFNGTIIPGATDYFYVAPMSGNYNVVATDENDCEVEAVINDVIAYTPLAAGYLPITIYPNPVIDKFTIQNLALSSSKGQVTSVTAVEISIYNMVGEKIMDVSPLSLGEGPGGEAVNCQLLPAGLYYLEIITDKKIYRTKFIKQ